MMVEMNSEKIDKLIVFVSEYSELYDMSSKNYNNQKRKETIWTEIGKKISENGEVCKNRWKSLRDGFNRIAKNNITKSGQAAHTNKKWKYWDAMSFLLPHIKGRETHSNVNNQSEDNEEEVDVESIEDQELSSLDSTPVRHISSKKRMSQLDSFRKEDSIKDIFREYVDEKKRSRTEKQKKVENQSTELVEFFNSMAKTVSKFPPLWQISLKSKIFQMVNSAEEQLLYQNQGTQSSSYTPLSSHYPASTIPSTLPSTLSFLQPYSTAQSLPFTPPTTFNSNFLNHQNLGFPRPANTIEQECVPHLSE